ncbi:hypothetical protein [Caudoviricetes sp.]|nr:hypothetical protein [Caudoviricetes sp.]
MLDKDLVRRAQDLDSNPALAEIVQRVVEKYTTIFINSAPTDVEAREDAYRMIKAVNELRAEIKAVAISNSVSAWNRGLRGKT